jgi:hypothetical protein
MSIGQADITVRYVLGEKGLVVAEVVTVYSARVLLLVPGCSTTQPPTKSNSIMEYPLAVLPIARFPNHVALLMRRSAQLQNLYCM